MPARTALDEPNFWLSMRRGDGAAEVGQCQSRPLCRPDEPRPRGGRFLGDCLFRLIAVLTLIALQTRVVGLFSEVCGDQREQGEARCQDYGPQWAGVALVCLSKHLFDDHTDQYPAGKRQHRYGQQFRR